MHNLKGSSVLITGAAGFLGSHIIPKLAQQGACVTGIDIPSALENSRSVAEMRSQAEFIPADIINFAQVDRLGSRFDYVIHLAAIAAPKQCDEDPTKAFLTNVQGTFNLLKFANNIGAKKFVFSSTAHVYGISPKYMPTDEKHPLALQDTYTTTKIIGENLCQLYYDNYNLEYIATRLFNGYGPKQSIDYFIPATIKKAINGKIELRGRHVTKDFVYVDDIANAFCRALESGYVGEINIGSGVQTTLESVARHIADRFGVELTFSSEDPGGENHMQSDTTRAERILGWKATTDIKSGLDMTIDFFKKATQPH